MSLSCPLPARHAPEGDTSLGDPFAAMLDDVLARLLGDRNAPSATRDAGRATPGALRAAAGALGRTAALGGLTPDALLARLEDGVLAAVAGDASGGPHGAADAVVLALWGGARDPYHDTRAAMDAAARRGVGSRGVAPRPATARPATALARG
jgi:hypothetical protein